MNVCLDCNSAYTKPGTCNCYAPGGKRYTPSVIPPLQGPLQSPSTTTAKLTYCSTCKQAYPTGNVHQCPGSVWIGGGAIPGYGGL